MINNKILGLLGLATRAGKTVFGTESSKEAIEKKIEEMCPYNPNKAEEIILNRFMYAVSAQDPIKVNTTIFMLSAMLIHFDEDSRTHFEQCIEMLKNQCMEKMETSYHYRRIKVLREKIYSK